MPRWPAVCLAFLATIASAGCIILNQQAIQELTEFQARQLAHSRLVIGAVALVMALPLAVWAGLVWGTRTVSVRSWWMLMTVECILLAIVSALRSYFY